MLDHTCILMFMNASISLLSSPDVIHISAWDSHAFQQTRSCSTFTRPKPYFVLRVYYTAHPHYGGHIPVRIPSIGLTIITLTTCMLTPIVEYARKYTCP